MATKSRQSESKGVPIAAIVIAVIALFGFVSYMAYTNLFAPPAAAPLTKKEQTNHDWIAAKYKETGGDMSKLSPEDNKKLFSIAGGYGANAWQSVGKEISGK